MIVGFQVLLIGLLADVISGNRKLLEDLLYRVRVAGAPAARDGDAPTRRRRAPRATQPIGGSTEWPIRPRSPSSFPRTTKPTSSARSSATLTGGRPWHEIIVVDDGSSDDTAARAAAAGATVVRHPYNKGNGAAVKSGIRARRRVRPDHRRRRPASARRCAAARRRGSASTISSSARARPRRRRPTARRLGNCALNWLASYLTGREIPDLTSGFRAARREYLREFLHLLPNGFSTPTTTTLAFIKAGYNVAFEPMEARQRVGTSKIRLARDGAKFLLIILKIVTIFSPLRIFLPISVASFVARRRLWGLDGRPRSRRSRTAPVLLILFAVVVFLVGPRVRTDLRAALRRPAVDGRVRAGGG